MEPTIFRHNGMSGTSEWAVWSTDELVLNLRRAVHLMVNGPFVYEDVNYKQLGRDIYGMGRELEWRELPRQ